MTLAREGGSVRYYAVYSLRTDRGAGFGRDTFTISTPIRTIEHIKEAERELLRGAREKEPNANDLFLVSWTELAE